MKKIQLSIIICAIPLLFNGGRLTAQEKLHYWSDSETYLQAQASYIFDEAYKVLSAHPPGTVVGSERRLALASLDALMHDTRLDNGTAFMSFMNQIYSNIALELRKNKPTGKTIRIFRLYDHGFILQTSSVTIAIDMIRGGRTDNPFVNETLIHSIVEQCDILFITHAHSDHADPVVAKMFCDQGKQVIAAEDIWKKADIPIHIIRGKDMIRESIPLQARNTALTVHVFPGTQGNVLNNVYLITLPEGQTIMHTGDQDFSEDLLAKAGAHKIDILFVQCWMLPMDQFVAGIKPALVITGHENEMLHTIDHREAYWLTFKRMSGVKVPYLIMAWGESYTTP